ncbi:MAG: aldehyde dehydrogenase family protein [Pseudomonadota bacterium]
MTLLGHSYIDGQWIESGGERRFDITNPTNAEVIGTLVSSSLSDVDRAVTAAQRAFLGWASVTPGERANYLQRVFDALTEQSEAIAQSITTEVGSTISLSRGVQAGAAISKFDYYADYLRHFEFEEHFGDTPVLREPIGVVACVTPWNFPLLQIAAKVAPALAAGCCVVLKPSEIAPTNALLLAQCVEAADLPKGVFNMVWGEGSDIGEHLVGHPGVDMVSFTGSTAAGRRIAAVAGQTIKRTAMELGGKSAAILLDDADFNVAIAGVLDTCFVNSGQSCTAHSRLIVPKSREQEAVRVARELAEQWTPGDPFDSTTKMGPLISHDHWSKVQGFITDAQALPHTQLVTGGAGKPEGLDAGYFVRPTVFAGVHPDDAIARDEIFGPVLSIFSVEDEDSAVQLANDTVYGLSGGVWSADQNRALKVARQMRTGTVEVNGGAFNGAAPFGGYKQSGLGREMGPHGFAEFLELKTLQI